MSYQRLINEIDPDVDAIGVEASMRLQYGTLDHLPRETFAQEIEIFKGCIAVDPTFGKRVAESMGMAS